MKQLKSTAALLRRLFEHSVSVSAIAEPLVSFDAESPAERVHAFMGQADYDAIGVRTGGLVSGYGLRSDLVSGSLGDYQKEILADALLSAETPLLEVFQTLRNHDHVFILTFGGVGGIVTRGDLQKAPVRL